MEAVVSKWLHHHVQLLRYVVLPWWEMRQSNTGLGCPKMNCHVSSELFSHRAHGSRNVTRSHGAPCLTFTWILSDNHLPWSLLHMSIAQSAVRRQLRFASRILLPTPKGKKEIHINSTLCGILGEAPRPARSQKQIHQEWNLQNASAALFSAVLSLKPSPPTYALVLNQLKFGKTKLQQHGLEWTRASRALDDRPPLTVSWLISIRRYNG